eukprot:GHVT01100486.1.p2 GENE.GHVT01100486.1~~GHVT01100486.1.p2  ORF type:complete len:103 (+),score=14.22 GHVT01100486.1:3329-3637(+)
MTADVIHNDFVRASSYVRALPKDGPVQPTTEQQLEFYKYFKQATEGDVTGDCPSILSPTARSKFKAWESVKGMSKVDAEKKYIEAMDKMQAAWRDDAKKLNI